MMELNTLIDKKRGITKARTQRIVARCVIVKSDGIYCFFLSRRRDIRDSYDECSAAAAGKNVALVKSGDHGVRAAEREARR